MRKKETEPVAVAKEVVSRRERAHKFVMEFAMPITDINVTPLVDICLVLVIIFLTFAPLIYLTGITVTRARAAKVATEVAATELKADVYLRADGAIVLNGEVISEDDLGYFLGELMKRSLNRTVTVSADPTVIHNKVVWLLDLAKDKGAVTLCIMKRRTAEEEASTPTGT